MLRESKGCISLSSQAAAFLQGPDHHTEASQGLLIFRGVGVGIGWSRSLGFVVFVVLLLTLFSELIPYDTVQGMRKDLKGCALEVV